MAEAATRPIRTGVFVDWNSQLRAVSAVPDLAPIEIARQALRRVGASVSKTLVAEAPNNRFRVDLRLYSGWTKGFTRSDYYKAITSLTEAFDLDALFPSSKIAVTPNLGFGDRLLEGLDTRLNPGLGVHLPNTLRQQEGGGPWREKMVDTALASDLLSWLRDDFDSWAVVVSNDDDLVPPVFVAEGWLQHANGRVLLLRTQNRPGDRFLRLDGLRRS